MEDEAPHEGKVLVDRHLELRDKLPGSRDHDALASGRAGDFGGLLEICHDARRRVDEAGDVGDGSNDGSSAKGRNGGGGREGVAFC